VPLPINRCLIQTISPLLQVQSYQLGSILRSQYFDQASDSFIHGINSTLVDTHQVRVLVKGGGVGGEGPVVFDSAIATLQGLFPPTSKNQMILPNDTAIVAPLGGYQYVPGLCSIFISLAWLCSYKCL
jgi:lysosomal acid phosphatase